MDRSLGRLIVEGLLGASAGLLLSVPLAGPGVRWSFALAGAVLAPLALLLTPIEGTLLRRALRYGLALAVLATLLVSFTGPGRERPVGELVGLGVLFFGIGAVGHSFLARARDPARGGDSGAPRDPRRGP
jgi:hypothetical protein